MKNLLIAIVFFITAGSAQPQYHYGGYGETNVIIALVTTLSDEAGIVDCFVEGYESFGRQWTGHIRVDTGVSSQSPLYGTIMRLARDSGYSIVLRNTGITDAEWYFDSAYANGIQLVACAGSNFFHFDSRPAVMANYITCGAGRTENVTAIACEFFDTHPFSEYSIQTMTDSAGYAIVTLPAFGVLGDSSGIGYQKVEFADVSGFTNNPSGLKVVKKFYWNYLYNKFNIKHSIGSGSLTGGKVRIFWQSYSHAYIAGKLAAIKDSLNCSWWEARYRMRMTASESGSFDTYDGYGIPDPVDAIAYNGSIPTDPFNLLGSGVKHLSVTRIGTTLNVTFDTISNAIIYSLYDNSQLIENYTPSQVDAMIQNGRSLQISLSRTPRNKPHNFWLQASRLSSFTAESDKSIVPFYRFKRIKIK